MNSSEPSGEPDLAEIYAFAAAQMVDGASEGEVKRMLFQKGIGVGVADEMISNLTALRAEVEDEEAREDMRHGSVWFFGGIAITAISYLAAAGDGLYIVTWGAILYGAILYMQGASRLSSQKGIGEATSSRIVSHSAHVSEEVQNGKARQHIRHGAIWCLVGIAVTAISYLSAGDTGAYVVTWGVILYGAVRLLYGVSQLNSD